MARWPPAPRPGALDALLEMLRECPPSPQLDFGEIFAGMGAVHRAVSERGYRFRAMDLEYHEAHDVMLPPCSSWVWMSRGSTGRDWAWPQGDTTKASVVVQNALVERMVILLEILRLRGCHYIIEQPASSVMWQYPALAACLWRHGLRGPVVLDMGAYGGTSWKPTHLWGTAPYLPQLARRCTAEERALLSEEGVQTTHKWVASDGRTRCQGTSDLKGTQAYPEGWGLAHAEAFAGHYGAPVQEPEGSSTATFQAAEHVQAVALLKDLPGFAEAWCLRDFLGEPWR